MKTYYEDTEEKVLVKQLVKGDIAAFRELYYRYQKPLHFFARKLTRNTFTAEEIIQDSFVKVWEKRKKLRPEQSFKGYVYKIVGNKVKNHLRNLARKKQLLDTYRQSVPEYYNHTENMVNLTLLQKEMDLIIEQLPPQSRKIYLLHHLDQKSNEEIARLLGISKRTVQNQLSIALRFIKNKLQPHPGMPLLAVICNFLC